MAEHTREQAESPVPAAPVADATFNISGWNSSYDGAPIPLAEGVRRMAEWVKRSGPRPPVGRC